MPRYKIYTDPWTAPLKRLKRKAKKEEWPIVTYWNDGWHYGYLKKRGPKWSHVVILVYRKKKVGERVDELTRELIPIYKTKYTGVTKRVPSAHVKPYTYKKGESK